MLHFHRLFVNQSIHLGLTHVEFLFRLGLILVPVEIRRKLHLRLDLLRVAEEHAVRQTDADGELTALLSLILVYVVWPDSTTVELLLLFFSAIQLHIDAVYALLQIRLEVIDGVIVENVERHF